MEVFPKITFNFAQSFPEVVMLYIFIFKNFYLEYTRGWPLNVLTCFSDGDYSAEAGDSLEFPGFGEDGAQLRLGQVCDLGPTNIL